MSCTSKTTTGQRCKNKALPNRKSCALHAKKRNKKINKKSVSNATWRDLVPQRNPKLKALKESLDIMKKDELKFVLESLLMDNEWNTPSDSEVKDLLIKIITSIFNSDIYGDGIIKHVISQKIIEVMPFKVRQERKKQKQTGGQQQQQKEQQQQKKEQQQQSSDGAPLWMDNLINEFKGPSRVNAIRKKRKNKSKIKVQRKKTT